MNTVIVNDVFKAPRSGAPPTFYLLPGIDGGNDLDPGGTIPPGGKAWFGMTDIQGFFANKNVNVVSPPLGGAFSWWTDWVADGSKQYQTYMTRELPPLINKEYHANGKNGVGGLSSTGGTAIDYAIQAPGVFKAVGSYSGFPSVSDPDEAQNISLTLSGGGQSAEAMWGGPLGGPVWVQHDPSKNAPRLKGVAVYAAASESGGVGDVDRLPPGFGPQHRGWLHRAHRRRQHQAVRRCGRGRRRPDSLRHPSGGLTHLGGVVRVGDAGVVEHDDRTGTRGRDAAG